MDSEKELNSKIRIKSVEYNVVMNIILKISQYIFPLITLPYVSRVLGTISNGKVAFATSITAYFSMFAKLGIPTYGIRACAKCRDNKDELTKTVQELLIINMVSLFLSFLLLAISIVFINKLQAEAVLIIIYSLQMISDAIGMEWLYQAIEQYQYITTRSIIFKLFSVILIFIFIHKPEDYILYAILYIISTSGSCVLNLINSKKYLLIKTYKGKYDFKQHLKPIFVFFALSVASTIYNNMDTVMLGFIVDDIEVAYYSLAVKTKYILSTTVTALGPVLMPRITYYLENGEKSELKQHLLKSLHFVIMISIPLTAYFVVMSPETVDILGGAEFAPAVSCMRAITLTVIPIGIGNIACQQVLAPTGKEKYIMYSTICGAVINFIVNCLLIPIYGALGAAIATDLTETIVAIIQIKYAWGELKDCFKEIPYLKLLVSNVVSILVLLIVNNSISINSSLMIMIITCIAYFVSYLSSLLLSKDELVVYYIKLLKEKIN